MHRTALRRANACGTGEAQLLYVGWTCLEVDQRALIIARHLARQTYHSRLIRIILPFSHAILAPRFQPSPLPACNATPLAHLAETRAHDGSPIDSQTANPPSPDFGPFQPPCRADPNPQATRCTADRVLAPTRLQTRQRPSGISHA